MHVKPLRTLLVPIATLSGLAIALPSLAHSTALDYTVAPAVAVSALYDTGKPMVEAQVSVFSPDDVTTPWITGTTDSQGNFIFMPDPAVTGNWEVQVRQAGHGEVIVIPMATPPSVTENLPPSGSAETATENPEAASAPVDLSPSVMPMSPQPRSSQLSPVQRWTMIGAIIWGFVGTAFFFASRTSVSDPAGEA
ncbi:MAG TPA: hypothetical protein V6D20_19270 [Candidatus Obscuribacterales bacterium]